MLIIGKEKNSVHYGKKINRTLKRGENQRWWLRFSIWLTKRNTSIPTRYVGKRNKNKRFGFRHIQFEVIKKHFKWRFPRSHTNGTPDFSLRACIWEHNLSVRALQVEEIPIGKGLEVKLKSLRECLYLGERGWEKRKKTKTVLDV